MKTLISILTALLLLGAAPALASEPGGGAQHGGGGYGGGHGGGGGCGGGCGGGGHGGGGHGGGGHWGGNVNVNVNANANASASAYAGAGAYINAQGYDVGAIRGQGGYGGTIVHGSGGVDMGGYGYGAGYRISISGRGYGPSRPFGYVAQGFGRRYVTTDRCCGLRPAPCYGCGGTVHPPAPPPPSYPPCNCQGGHGHDGHGGGYGGGYGHEQSYYGGGASYSRYESYSESSSQGGGYGYAGGYQGGSSGDYGDRYSDRRDDGPRYAPIPYQASPLEPVAYDAYASGGYGQAAYAPPPVTYDQPAYAPVEPQVYQPAPVYIQAPQDYYGDLPPGDTGVGYPYRQEPGERG